MKINKYINCILWTGIKMLGEMNIDWVDGRRTSLACSFLIKFIRPENKIAFYYPIVNEFPQ